METLIKLKKKNTGAQPGGSIVAPPAGHGVLVPYPHVQPALASTSSILGEGFSLAVQVQKEDEFKNEAYSPNL